MADPNDPAAEGPAPVADPPRALDGVTVAPDGSAVLTVALAPELAAVLAKTIEDDETVEALVTGLLHHELYRRQQRQAVEAAVASASAAIVEAGHQARARFTQLDHAADSLWQALSSFEAAVGTVDLPEVLNAPFEHFEEE